MMSVIVPGFAGATSHDCGGPPLLPCDPPECGAPPLLPCDSEFDLEGDTTGDTDVVPTDVVVPGADPSLPQAVPPSEVIDYIYRFGLGIGAFLAFGWIVYAGFRYAAAGDSPSVRSEARDQITQALLGLLLLVGATALLNLVNSRLTTLIDPALVGVGAPPPVEGEITPEPPGEPVEFGELSEEEAGNEASVRAALAAAGVTINRTTPCPPGVTYQAYSRANPGSGCTSVGGFKTDTLNYIIWLKSICGCNLQVSGGSELGHAGGASGITHTAGRKIDFGDGGSTVNAWVRAEARRAGSGFTNGGVRSGIHGGPRIWHKNAQGQVIAEWIYEQGYNHWDVAVHTSVPQT